MKFRKGFIALIMSFVVVLQFISVSTIPAFAHNSMLDVDYDNCQAVLSGDGIDEVWYILEQSSQVSHISHEVHTIKYYFEEYCPGTNITWVPEGKSSLVGEEIKNAYANSMKKWNSVYFYSCNQDGTITKNKLIDIVEGTASDHNLTIYPITGYDGTMAMTGAAAISDELIVETGNPTHTHYSDWVMLVNIDYFYPHAQLTSAVVDFIKDRNGAHELGHVLGLVDVDLLDDAYEHICGSNLDDEHHYELLMGYGKDMLNRSSDITYKDIAGVAITRGFHTDSDHKWLNCGVQSNGKYKLLCSICNGIIEVSSLSGYTYKTYGACGNNHNLSDGNMMAVASYGTKDYYKCEYCRYVAPFDSNVTQNYTKTNYNSSLHKCVNNVNGLEYTFYEEHMRDTYVYVDKFNHIRKCSCGTGAQTEKHTISASDVTGGGNFAPCMGCGYLLDLRDDNYNTIASITQVSINGSYILPSGIVVLVDEDIQAYLDGTLVFYHPDNIPATQ